MTSEKSMKTRSSTTLSTVSRLYSPPPSPSAISPTSRHPSSLPFSNSSSPLAKKRKAPPSLQPATSSSPSSSFPSPALAPLTFLLVRASSYHISAIQLPKSNCLALSSRCIVPGRTRSGARKSQTSPKKFFGSSYIISTSSRIPPSARRRTLHRLTSRKPVLPSRQHRMWVESSGKQRPISPHTSTSLTESLPPCRLARSGTH